MEPTRTQRAICSICSKAITRHRGLAWLHDGNVRDKGHAARPRYVAPDGRPDVDPFDPTDVGDWSQHGKTGPTPTDRHCPDCGAEVEMAGRQCPRCTDRTITELDR